MKITTTLITSLLLCASSSLLAQAPAATAAPAAPVKSTLELLLEEVRSSIDENNRFDRKRERLFRLERDTQRQNLAKAKRELKAEEARSDRLRNAYDNNEKKLAELVTVLQDRMGNLGEMFGVVKQVAGDARSQFKKSIVSAQIPGRTKFVSILAERKALPTVDELRRLWYELQREITEQGRVVRFPADVLRADGRIEKDVQVTRIGVFNVIDGGKYLQWDWNQEGISEGILKELPRQPAQRYQDWAEEVYDAAPGTYATMPIDPTSGAILSLVIRTPDLKERIHQGKEVGYVIIFLGIIGLAIALWRLIYLSLVGMRISAQRRSREPSLSNPLGRVMAVYAQNPDTDVETLELKLDEAILKETAPLESWLGAVKILYVVSPLLGLLGTVTGMIETFQQITLFGTGDAATMAGGISQALVTTVLGLTAAIPLTLAHSFLASKAKNLVHILEEQSAGVIAMLAEKRDAGAL